MTDRQSIFQHQFDNGLTLVAQSMPWLQSAAFSCAVPAGCSHDPADLRGLSNFCCEMVFRGGGPFTNRLLVEELEGLGCDYFSGTSVYHSFFGGAMPADGLERALEVYAQVLRNPLLPPDQLEDGRMTCLQEIQSLEDDLASKVMIDLRRRHYGEPFGRNCEGQAEHLLAIKLDDIRSFYEQHYSPRGAIIAVAGKIDWTTIRDKVAKEFGDWPALEIPAVQAFPAEHGNKHILFNSNQTHIGIAWPNIPYSHRDYYRARGAVGVLSDGMSSRLFREVRDRRGLCYTVSANCHSLRDRGCVVSYCGTTTENAQQSLDVIIGEVQKLAQGISQEELDRLRIQIRSGLIMQQESCRSRVATLVGDILHLGRVRPIDEVSAAINDLSVASINSFLNDNPPGPFDLVTLGERPLELCNGVLPTSTK